MNGKFCEFLDFQLPSAEKSNYAPYTTKRVTLTSRKARVVTLGMYKMWYGSLFEFGLLLITRHKGETPATHMVRFKLLW